MFKKEREYVKKRKSYYGFAKNYPGKLGSSKYVIGESRAVRKRETLRSIIIGLIIVLIFVLSFVFTSVCLEISEKEPETNKKNISATIQVADIFLLFDYSSSPQQPQSQSQSQSSQSMSSSSFSPQAGHSIYSSSSISSSRKISSPQEGHSTS